MTVISSLEFDAYAENAEVTDGSDRPWYIVASTTKPYAKSIAAAHGARGVEVSTASTVVKFEYREVQSTATRVISQYFKLIAAPAAQVNMGDLADGSTYRADWRINSDRTVTIRNNFVAVGGPSPQALALNVWYRSEWMTSASGQELRIYQSESTTPYITRAGALTSNQHTLISSGITANANSYTVHFDTVRVADDWLGPFDSQPPVTEPTALRYDGANWIGLDKPVVIA